MNKTINYYNNNAQSYYNRTININHEDNYKIFLEQLSKKAHILDAGCGIGRDSKYFLNLNYKVTAFDASQEMVKMASQEVGIDVLTLTFQEMNFDQKFDAVWANASLLHVSHQEIRLVYENIYRALRPGGIFFASYKYGKNYVPTLERDFWDMDEEMVKPFFKDIFDSIKIWKADDMEEKNIKNSDEKWLHFIVRKKIL